MACGARVFASASASGLLHEIVLIGSVGVDVSSCFSAGLHTGAKQWELTMQWDRAKLSTFEELVQYHDAKRC